MTKKKKRRAEKSGTGLRYYGVAHNEESKSWLTE